MQSIILYLGLCVLGYFVGIPLRKYSGKLHWISPAQSATVLLLVFTMGAKIGSNGEILNNLGKYGVYALIFTFVIFIFSLIFASIARRLLGIDRYGSVKSDKDSSRIASRDSKENTDKNAGLNKFTVFIAASVVLGIFAGYMIYVNLSNYLVESETIISNVITMELCTLLIFVGIDMGLAGEVVDNFKKVGLRVLAIPISIGLGTLLGAFMTGLILPLEIKESLAIGAGFGWYSLGAAIIMDGGMVRAGAISFLHNVMREFFSFLLIPLVAKRIGYVESVALPAAPAMDVCLPMIVQSTNTNVAVYSFVTGLVLSAAVPIIVPLFV